MDRFECGLVCGLSMAVGALGVMALSPGLAVGHDAAMVSLGSNPVYSTGGTIGGGALADVTTAYGGGDFLIQDLVLTATVTGHQCSSVVAVVAAGSKLGEFRLSASRDDSGRSFTPSVVSHHFNSGLNVPEGSSVTIDNTGSCTVSYTVAGRTVKP